MPLEFRDKVSAAFLPMNLVWSNFETRTLFVPRIGPRLGRHCDLGHVIWPAERAAFAMEEFADSGRDATLFSLDLAVKPNTGTHLLQPGIYQMDFSVAARNAKTITGTVRILLTGRWFDDEGEMLRDGIFIDRMS